ncbi:nuclear receptor-interacting protein 2 [Scleropages formosus]|uniref:Nuclear receptor interacting protein 2 n=1 Tax=Scleropages formosus TaxID=113540 RepID=A0A8C9V8Q0_SCLFO|nr:nuclear receptor-interacting protein 2 [Scleropages formosus]
MSEAKKSELHMRDKAILHQQRRLKQATQFTHKDSADLLPLDGLKRLGTSKDLQPHCIVQRRLLESNVTRLRGETRDTGARVRSPLADNKEGAEAEEKSESTPDDSTEDSEKSLKSEEEEEAEEETSEATSKVEEHRRRESTENNKCDTERMEEGPGRDDSTKSLPLAALVVRCKCCEKDVKASINTGRQRNRISLTCCRRLGLQPAPEAQPCGRGAEDRRLSATLPHTVTDLQLQLGGERIRCSAHVVEDEGFELCLGLQTLLELKCCVDLDSRVLRLHGSKEELAFLETSAESLCHQDNNKNTTI